MRNIGLISIVACFVGSAAFAEGNACASRDALAKALELSHGEVPISGGVHGTKHLLEVFSSPDNATWTIVVTETSGVSCVVASGTSWHMDALLPDAQPG